MEKERHDKHKHQTASKILGARYASQAFNSSQRE